MMITGEEVYSCPWRSCVRSGTDLDGFPPFPAGAYGGRKARKEIDWDVSPSETDIKTVWEGGGKE